MNNIFSLIRFEREFAGVLGCIGDELSAPKPLPIIVNGLSGGMNEAFIHEAVLLSRQRVSLILVGDEHTGRRLTARLDGFGVRPLYFPERELMFHNISASHDTERERLFVLHSVICGECNAVITTPAAALSFTMPRKVLSDGTLHIQVGNRYDISTLCEKLTNMGYRSTESVESVGQFSHRGGIVDIFTYGSDFPVRIEFFDDEADRMGYFDIMTQRIGEGVDSVTVLPAKEMTVDSSARERIRKAVFCALKKCKDDDVKKELRAEIAVCEGGADILFSDKYMSCIYPEAECLIDYFSNTRAVVYICESNRVSEHIKSYESMMHETVFGMVEKGLITSEWAEYGMCEADYDVFIANSVAVHVNAFSGGLGSMKCAGIFGFRGRKTVSYDGKYQMLKDDLSNFITTHYRTVISAGSESEAKSIINSLSDDGIITVPIYENASFDFHDMKEGAVYVALGSLSSGFELIAQRVALLTLSASTSDTVTRRQSSKRKRHVKNAGERIMSFADLHEGDYVVHATHGIGMYAGMTTLRTDGVLRDYITINYAGADKLFLPADRLELISKYIGTRSEDGTVKLSKLGGTEWQRATAKAKASAKDMAKDLIRLYAERQKKEGFAFPRECSAEREFADSFEFEETEPQLNAIEEITADMERVMPMDRLLCGDVGFGKTEVAFRAAFKAICAGKQVAMLVPTTILALQHYQTAMSRMRGYPVNIEMLSRFRTSKESALILRRLKRGDIDLIIGTHKLLSKEVEFKDLGLLIVDEEQRFGVGQKEKIKMRAANVDVLTLTATPIPRTLNMAMSGIRDMSILDEAPGDRMPPQTYVLEYDEIIIEDAISKELARKGQVLYLYNNIENIDLVCARIAKKFPEAHVEFAHGQMEHDELEDIWQALVRGDIDILVCTTIIETGVDLPNANTLIIENADRMGLSQLHQIRGRIGRSGRQAYAYFTYRRGKALSEIAEKRLSAIRDYAEFGAGFKVALRDLEIRGAGNLLGCEQHGNIDAVGYDMYVKLLNEAVLEEKGEKKEAPYESRVDIHADCNIPDYYIRSSSLRMEMYKKISLITCEDDRRDVFDELCDRFSDPPIQTVRLLYVSMVRALASKYRIAKVTDLGAEIRFTAPKFDISIWSELFMEFTGMRFVATGAPYISYKLRKGEDAAITAGKILVEYDRNHSAVYSEKEGQKNDEGNKQEN